MGGQQVSSSFASLTEMRSRAWKNPHSSSRARSSTALVYGSRSAARSCCGVGSGLPLRDTFLASRRRASVTSRIVGRSGRGRSRAAPRDDPRFDPPSHLVDHRERPAGRNRLRSARHRNGEIESQPERESGPRGEPPPPHRPGTVTAAGRCFLGSFTTTAAYEASIASRTSSSGIAPPTRNVFHPDRPM
jgi:hypothetical protein